MKKITVLSVIWLAVSCTRVNTVENAALPARPAESTTATQTQNDPELNERTNPMDGQKRYTLRFPSDGRGEAEGDLLVRCSTGEAVDAYVIFGKLVESTNGRSAVRIKFDEDAPLRQLWRESTDYEALFCPAPRQFLDQLTTHRLFILEHEVFRGPAVITRFDVSSARRVIPNLLSACGVTQREKTAKEKAFKRAANEALWESTMRKLLEPHITICKAEPFRSWGRWCYYDPAHAGSSAESESAPFQTREEAMQGAVDHSKVGRAFCIESIKASKSTTGDLWSACSDYLAAASGVIDLRQGQIR